MYSFPLEAISAAGRIMSMKNSSDTIGNRTRDLPASSAVPQLNEPLCAPALIVPSFLCLGVLRGPFLAGLTSYYV